MTHVFHAATAAPTAAAAAFMGMNHAPYAMNNQQQYDEPNDNRARVFL